MPHYKITCKQDIIDLQEKYEDNAIFENIETGEEFCLADLLFLYDNQEITIQHI